MDFNFDDFEQPERSQKNLEDIMEQVDRLSDDWAKFDDPQAANSSVNKSNIEEQWQKSQKSEKSPRNMSHELNNSRNISEISYQNGYQPDTSFKYESEPVYEQPQVSQRYDRIQKLLAKAKTGGMQAFYRNIDKMQMKETNSDFKDKKQFVSKVASMKEAKRQEEVRFQEVKKTQPKKAEKKMELFGKGDFSKKAYKGDMLPSEFAEEKEEEDNYFFGQTPNFFEDDHKKEQIREERQSLSVIREEKPTQQKLTNLLDNYQEMKKNFNSLITEIKQTGHGQQKIVEELKEIKQEYRTKEQQHQQNRSQQQQNKQKQVEDRNQNLVEIKSEIINLKEEKRQGVFQQMNERIQQLQSAVKQVLDQLVDEKQSKFTPKVIKYYDQESRKDEEESQANFSEQQVVKKQGFDNNPRPTAYEQKKASRYSSRQNSSRLPEQFCSPFELDLSIRSTEGNAFTAEYQQVFESPPFGKEYFPAPIESKNRNIRKCLTLKSSLVFQSFQFHISARYVIMDDEQHPVMTQLRIGNKCAIDLSDILIILYGPQGMDLMTKPTSRICRDKLKFNESFTFQVYINKQCLEDQGFSMQISYKTDSMSKKKINFKVPLPTIQLMKPEFTYEEQFTSSWLGMQNQLFVKPSMLDFRHIRSHEDLKLALPLIQLTQDDPQVFSYGIMFNYPKVDNLFMLKICCYLNGKASIHLKSQKSADVKLREHILDVISFLFFV